MKDLTKIKEILYSLSPAGLKALNSAFEMNQKLWEDVSKYSFEPNKK